MKKIKMDKMTAIFAIVLGALMVFCMVGMPQYTVLMASEGDGTVTAIEQQQEAIPASIDVPKQEESGNNTDLSSENSSESEEDADTGELYKEDVSAETPTESALQTNDEPYEGEAGTVSREDAPKGLAEEKRTEVENKYISVAIKAEDTGTIRMGDTVTLHATVTGADHYDIGWLVNKGDGSGWSTITGANDNTFKFVATEENYDYSYSADVTSEDQKITSGAFHLPAVADDTTEENETGEEAAETEDSHHIEITCDYPAGATIESGTVVTFHARLTGYKNENYTVQWQISYNGTDFTDIPGANSLDYPVAITEENAQCSWRVIVNSDEDVPEENEPETADETETENNETAV